MYKPSMQQSYPQRQVACSVLGGRGAPGRGLGGRGLGSSGDSSILLGGSQQANPRGPQKIIIPGGRPNNSPPTGPQRLIIPDKVDGSMMYLMYACLDQWWCSYYMLP